MIKEVDGKWILFEKGGKKEIARFGSEQAAKDWEKEHKESSKGSK
jgi:hypothetical protein